MKFLPEISQQGLVGFCVLFLFLLFLLIKNNNRIDKKIRLPIYFFTIVFFLIVPILIFFSKQPNSVENNYTNRDRQTSIIKGHSISNDSISVRQNRGKGGNQESYIEIEKSDSNKIIVDQQP